MSKTKKATIEVQGTAITILPQPGGDYISLTDMLRAKDGEFFISDWLRNRNTVEFLGIWESVFNPGFNYGEFARIKSQAGLNSYKLSVKDWVEKTHAIGLQATRGRYGGTFAHPDIAFEFGMWISPEFKIYLVKEFRRLKEEESDRLKLGWNLQRTLAKINYRIHTDAIREALLPPAVTKAQASNVYANEADLLNVALFGRTARQWRDAHLAAEGNIRDHATLEQLVVLTNLESLNSVLIRQGLPQPERVQRLNEIAISQMRTLLAATNVKRLAQPPPPRRRSGFARHCLANCPPGPRLNPSHPRSQISNSLPLSHSLPLRPSVLRPPSSALRHPKPTPLHP
ncbi:MAG: KilA-N domain-containing protein [Opitutae bacterium]|nr:KilA-N domain-containing protein [Opitutae bacterium]